MDLRSIINKISEAETPIASWTPTPEQEKWLGGADRQDPSILSRMPGTKPPVTYFKDPADQALAKQLGFPSAAPAVPTTGQSAQPASNTDVLTKIEKLNQLVSRLTQPAAQPTAKPAVQPTSSQAAQPAQKAQITQNQDGTFTATKKDGSTVTFDKDGKILSENSIAKSLIESFGYEVNEAALTMPQFSRTAGVGLAKAGAKTVAKAIPGVGTTLSAIEAYNRWKEGDRSGAVIATLAGIGWLIPGPLGWTIGGGLDAANLARDMSNDSEEEKPAQAAQPKSTDPKIVALQKYLVSQGAKNKDGTPLTVDGIMGPNTQAAMDAANLSESQKIAVLRLQLEPVNEGVLSQAIKSGGKYLKGLKTGFKDLTPQQAAMAKNLAGPANRAGQATAKAIKGPVGKAGALGAAAGAGYVAGTSQTSAPQPVAATPKPPTSSQGARPVAKAAAKPDNQALIAEIESLIVDLKKTANGVPEADLAVHNAQQALTALQAK